MVPFEQQLTDHRRIGLDTAIFVYHFEANLRYLPLTRRVLNRVQSGEQTAVTSILTLMELTVHPWRLQRGEIARQYETLLVHFPNLFMADVTREIARRAAQLRAEFNLRPADALQAATAIELGATAIVTNDLQLRRLSGQITTVILDDFV